MNDFFSVENDVLFHIFILLWLFWILKPQTLWFYHINYSALDVTLLIVSLDSRKYEHVIWSYPRTRYCKYLQPVLTKITEKERRVQLRISFRHLLMNLKDNYLLKRLLKLKANTLLTIRKNFSLKKWNKHLQRCYHFTCSYQKWWSYDVWFLIYGLKQTDFFVILGHFLFFYTLSLFSPNNQENKKKSQ